MAAAESQQTARIETLQSQRCGNCRYYKPDLAGGHTTQGYCHRYPPTVNAVLTPKGPVTATANPTVRATGFCGEFKARWDA